MASETKAQIGRCDFKQYEHCGPHERIPEIGQRLPPFGCKNWKLDAAPEPTTAEAAPLTRFRISYNDGVYRVSIPRYHGGEVVNAEAYDANQRRIVELEEALREMVNSAIDFNDPRISYVSMQVDRNALAAAQRLVSEGK